jgi:hypothetical protein
MSKQRLNNARMEGWNEILQIPTAKLQTNLNRQQPNHCPIVRSQLEFELKFGASLVLGAWRLMLLLCPISGSLSRHLL